MKTNIFVYGTLMKNMTNSHLLSTSKFLGNYEIDGYEMYDLGSYPGIIHGNGKIKGEVYQIDDITSERISVLEVRNQDDLNML